MRGTLVAGFAVLLAAACAPPAEAPTAAPEAPAAPAADLGPYANSWDSDAVSRFTHTLHAATPGTHTIELSATTTSPGGETVAVYPIGPDGAPLTTRLVFVIATTAGNSETAEVEIPAEGLPVSVAVENASGRRFSGQYTLTVRP